MNASASELAGGASLGADNGPAPALALALAARVAASSASASARSASSRARLASARSAFPTCAAHARSRRNESCRTKIPPLAKNGHSCATTTTTPPAVHR